MPGRTAGRDKPVPYGRDPCTSAPGPAGVETHKDLSSVTSLLPLTQLSVSLTVVIQNVVIGKVVIRIVDNHSVDS